MLIVTPVPMHQPDAPFDFVCSQARQATLLQTTAETLEWDDRTGLPAKAGEYRSQQISMLRTMAHNLRTDPRYGEALSELLERLPEHESYSDRGATIRELHRDWQRDRKLPVDLVEKLSHARTMGQQTWDAARKADDFAMFAATLRQIIELKREAGQRMAEGTSRSPYEALLDEYEPDARVADLRNTFNDLRQPLVELINELRDAPRQPETSILHGNFPIDAQREFCGGLATRIGFDFSRGRLDETSHPFCTTLGPNDCRILTRYDERFLSSGLFGMLHEAGHGMYEQGLRPDWFGLPPGMYASLGIHESQSRLWENQIGRSRAFWSWLLSDAQHVFAPELHSATVDSIYSAVNAVQPSLIRVEADEVTYNLHIIIRFDLEQQLISGELSVAELPDAWDDRYHKDLGVRAPSARDGVLQDVHWSAGLIGYFPTYTLGNLASAQLFNAAKRELGDLDEAFSRGQFEPLLDWLHRKIHQPGRCYSGAELVRRATGQPLAAGDLVAYLQGKLRPLYGLDSSSAGANLAISDPELKR